MNTNEDIKNSVRINITHSQAQKLLEGKCIWKNIDQTTYSIKVGDDAKSMKEEVKILRGQVYNQRAEAKKMREVLIDLGYNPSEIKNTPLDKLKTIKPTRKNKKKK